MSGVTVKMDIGLSQLAEEFVEAKNPQTLINFIIEVDACMQDLSFTTAIRDRLNKIIEEELN